MSIHGSGTPFYYYSLPTILEGTIDATNKEIIIQFVEGQFVLDYGLMFNNHDIVIKGAGMGKTILKIDESHGFIDYEDDAIFNFQGEDTSSSFCPISVRIEDLTIMTNKSKQETEGNSQSDIAHKVSHLVKCYNVRSLVLRNVEIQASNIATTCLDVRRGSNIDIRGCVFANYNRRWEGGCIWLRGDIENVAIEDNDFYKYGNDELIGIWGSNNYYGSNYADTISKKNINISFNRIYSQDTNGGENSDAIIDETVPGRTGNWDGCNQRFITLYANQKDNVIRENLVSVPRETPCLYTINGIHITNNEFFINAPIDYLLTIAFDRYTTHKDISINSNIIKYGNWSRIGKLVDFSINYDTQFNSLQSGDFVLFSDEVFSIIGNTIIGGQNKYYEDTNNPPKPIDNHLCLEFNGVVVRFDHNTIDYSRGGYMDVEANSPYAGLDLFRTSQTNGGTILFNENHCLGLKRLLNASTLDERGIPIVKLIGKGNHLHGTPRINYSNVAESHVSLIGNELICDYKRFLLSGFAASGTVIFVNNHVYRDLTRVPTNNMIPDAQLFSNTANITITSLQFICCQNSFENLQYNSSMYSGLQNNSSIKFIHTNNTFADYIE